MATFKKYEIGEIHPVVIDLGSHLAEEHVCKQIESIVSELDTSSLEANYKSIGQNALHPKLMLSVIFYGYTEGIRSGRKLSKACEENIPFIYLSKGYSPKKSALNDFRKDNCQHFSDLFIQVLKKCMDADLADPSLSIVDGSKLESDSSKRHTKTKEKYEKWQAHLLADIASLQSTLEKLPLEEEPQTIKKKLKAKTGLEAKVKDAIEVLDKKPFQKHINLTDPDAPFMKGKKGNFGTNYNIQIACGEDQVITFCDVITQGNDKSQLVPSLKGIINNTHKEIKTVLADADYGTFDSLAYMAQSNMVGYVPYRDMNTPFKDQPFHTVHFVYDQENDFYTCPAGKQLSYYHTSEDKKRKQFFRQYRTDLLQTCKQCPFRDQCLPNKVVRRVIKRETRQHLRDEMKQRLNSDPGRQMYRKRLHPIESFFGHIKHNLRYTRFMLRGLQKVKAEFTLICLTYNLRKLIAKLIRFLTISWPLNGLDTVKKHNQIVISNLSMNFLKHFKYD